MKFNARQIISRKHEKAVMNTWKEWWSLAEVRLKSPYRNEASNVNQRFTVADSRVRFNEILQRTRSHNVERVSRPADAS